MVRRMVSQCGYLSILTILLLPYLTAVNANVLGSTDLDSAKEEPTRILGSATTLRSRGSVEYNNPSTSGGYMLTIVNGTFPAGLGEPLNVILSAESDDAVLVRDTANGGFLNYMLSTNLGEECLGQHLGSNQAANLGDGHGNVSEVEELRWNFGNPYIGSCEETFSGGLHLRYWIQNTTGAYFMAVSVEKDLASGHDIILDGYNAGRDFLIGNLTKTQVASRNVTNQTVYAGSTTYANYTYLTTVKYVSNLLQNSSDGINHFLTVEEDGYPAIDGLVAVLTVKITASPKSGALAKMTPVSFTLLLIPTFFVGLLSLI